MAHVNQDFSEIFNRYKKLSEKFPWSEHFILKLQNYLLESVTTWAEKVSEIDTSEQFIATCSDWFLQDIEKAVDGIMILTNTLYEVQLETVSRLANKLENLQLQANVKLETDLNENQTICIQDYRNSLKSKINKLEEEIKFKKQIDKYKTELNKIWDRCHCDQSVRNEFPVIYTQQYNRENLILFEKEISKWTDYYDKHKEILKCLEEYKCLFEKIMEIELNVDYKNRCAKLLVDTRRLKLSKTCLQKTKNTLITLANSYFKKNGDHFLSFGQTIEAILQSHSSNTKKLQCTPKKNSSAPAKSASKSQSKSGVIKVQKKYPKNLSQLPKFKLNDTKMFSPKKKSVWKPSRLSLCISDREYSDFEEKIKECPRSSSFSK